MKRLIAMSLMICSAVHASPKKEITVIKIEKAPEDAPRYYIELGSEVYNKGKKRVDFTKIVIEDGMDVEKKDEEANKQPSEKIKKLHKVASRKRKQ